MPIVTPLFENESEAFFLIADKIRAKKKELFKKYKKQIDSGDENIIPVIEKELIQYAKDELGDDGSLDVFNNGENADYGNNFKNMFVMKGLVKKSSGKGYNVITSDYTGGISKDEYVAFAESLAAGPYARARKTATGGYWEKLFRVFEHIVLDKPGSDCGTKRTIEVEVTDDMLGYIMYSYIVDGGKAHDPDVNKMDCMGSQMFNYMIDGGSAAKREFMNNSIHTKLIGTEFQMNALISTAEGNPIQVVSDGLFVDINSFGSQAEFDNTVHTLIDLANQIYIGNNTIDEDIAVIADKDLRLSRIRRILNSIIINMLEVNYLMKDNHFINMVYNEIDAVISVFDSHYTTEDSTNPYIWQDL
jgi:hypothetical protein